MGRLRAKLAPEKYDRIIGKFPLFAESPSTPCDRASLAPCSALVFPCMVQGRVEGRGARGIRQDGLDPCCSSFASCSRVQGDRHVLQRSHCLNSAMVPPPRRPVGVEDISFCLSSKDLILGLLALLHEAVHRATSQ